MRRWFKNYGFAILVVAGIASAVYLGATVAVPDPVPDFALRAREIYRLEIGMAFFIAFYLTAMALALALDGRGFVELGNKGLRAERIVNRAADKYQRGLRHQASLDRRTKKRLDEHEMRLKQLEAKSLG